MLENNLKAIFSKTAITILLKIYTNHDIIKLYSSINFHTSNDIILETIAIIIFFALLNLMLKKNSNQFSQKLLREKFVQNLISSFYLYTVQTQM